MHLSDADIVLSMFIVYIHVIPSKCAAIYLVYSAVNTVFWNFNASTQNRGMRVVKETADFNGRVVYRLHPFRRGRARNVVCCRYIYYAPSCYYSNRLIFLPTSDVLVLIKLSILIRYDRLWRLNSFVDDDVFQAMYDHTTIPIYKLILLFNLKKWKHVL